MEKFVTLTLLGVSRGMIYSLVALSLVLIWRATRVVNFAQGAMAMFTTYIAYTLVEHGYGYWAAFVLTLVVGFLLGGVVERVLIRPVESGNPLNAVIVALGLLVFLQALAPLIWGGGIRSYPPAFGRRAYQVGGYSTLSPFDLFIIAAVAVVAVLLALLFRFTGLGLRMRAAAFEPEVARLLGVPVGRMLTLGWALAAIAGSLAGLLAAPFVFVSPNNMDGIFVYGFTAAVIGGLDSPVGAVVGGVGLGVLLSYSSGYVSPNLVAISALLVLIVLLMVRPNGLFARTSARRV